ncbi:MAG TPA: 30S ribosomal protein S1 [Pyrinomonadaceae bacterium]|nr:30S ribosomal protein S1 [Pyrinomonadaceae bacterium]
MSTEENQPRDGETTTDNPRPAGETGAATAAAPAGETTDPQPNEQQQHPAQPSDAPAPADASGQQGGAKQQADDDDDDEGRGGGFDFGAILDQYEQEQAQFQEGAVVRGIVVGINDRGVMIDFGFKSEGFVPVEEFTENGEVTVKRGDEVEVLVKHMESQEGVPVLSRADAVRMRAWDELEKAYRDGTPVKGRVVERVKGGVRVDVDGVAAFLPGSQIDSRPVRNLDSYRNQEIEAKVIKLNRKRSNVVLSRKAILDEQNAGKKGETLNNLEEGIIVDGQIKNLTDYGAFVDLGGIDGLLHVTDMSWGRLQNPGDMFKVGDNVQVKVLKFDKERERVSLGYKQLLPDPWESVDERYLVGSRVSGSVASVTDYGAFVELEPGIEGLVHVSEMSWSKRMKHPSKLVNPGDKVEAVVLGVDPKNRRISLGMKQVQPNPWDTLRERYQIGTRVTGRVRNLTDFGAFIEVEEGVDGLVHVTDISWNKRIKHPGEALKKGQEIDAVVTNIDTENRRLSLSIKDTEPSSWDKFVHEHHPGDVVKGKISRFANFGAFVELADGLEGLCHVSELSEERVDKPEDVAQVGQEMEFRILRIDPETRKIGLSARAAGSSEPIVDTKSYSTEAKGGMASLAELANLGFGTSAPKAEEPKAAEPAAETAAPEAAAEPAASDTAATDTGTTETAAAESATSETTASEPRAEESQPDATAQSGEGGGESGGEGANQG